MIQKTLKLMKERLNKVKEGTSPSLLGIRIEKSEKPHSHGINIVRFAGKYNYVDEDLNLIAPDKLFNEARHFVNGLACVNIKGKYNVINDKGNLLIRDELTRDNTSGIFIYRDGFVRVAEDGYVILVDKEGNEYGHDIKAGLVRDFCEGYGVAVFGANEYNLIDTKGKLWFDKNFISLSNLSQGWCVVELERGVFNYINLNGEILSKVNFDAAYSFYGNGYALVRNGDLYNLINLDGELLFKDAWCTTLGNFIGGWAIARPVNKKYANFINEKGEWFFTDEELTVYQSLRTSMEHCFEVCIDFKWYYMDFERNLYSIISGCLVPEPKLPKYGKDALLAINDPWILMVNSKFATLSKTHRRYYNHRCFGTPQVLYRIKEDDGKLLVGPNDKVMCGDNYIIASSLSELIKAAKEQGLYNRNTKSLFREAVARESSMELLAMRNESPWLEVKYNTGIVDYHVN